MRRLLVLLVIFAVGVFVGRVFAPSRSRPRPNPNPTTRPQPFSPLAIWPVERYFAELSDCVGANDTETSCSLEVMQKHRATADAYGFFQTTHWFMRRFHELGTVDLAEVFNPWRANTNDDYLLVNGSPLFVTVEREAPELSFYDSDPALAKLKSAFKELTINGGDEVFEAKAPADNGGSSFIFQFQLADGCHACAIGYWARQAFDFQKDGTFTSPRTLNICRGDAVAEGQRTVDVGAPACPQTQG